LSEIANWLEKNDVPMNIKTFAIINDNREFSRINTRYHGKRISIGAIPTLYLVSDNYNYPDTSVSKTNHRKGIGFIFEYDNSKAISQYVSSDFSLMLSKNFQNGKNEDFIQNAFNVTALKVAYGIKYNPNSRTIYGLDVYGLSSIFNSYKSSVMLGVSLFGNFFLNYRTNLTATVSANYSVTNPTTPAIPSPVAFNTTDNTLFRFTTQFSNYIHNEKNLNIYSNLRLNYTLF
jgi:hypothetical protein